MATPCLFLITVIDGPVSKYNDGRYPKIYLPMRCCASGVNLCMAYTKNSCKQLEHVNNCGGCMSFLEPIIRNTTPIELQSKQWHGCGRQPRTFLRIRDLPKAISGIFNNLDFNNFHELWTRMNTHAELHMIQIIHQILKCCITYDRLYQLLNM
jgi:dTDP-D-glucose 4,6-dehydratase